MKAEAELNALLLQAKNYERLKEVDVVAQKDRDLIDVILVRTVPKPMTDYFLKRIRELVKAEVEKAAALVEQAAKAYAKAAIE